jgi:hypothetical protein
MNKKRQSTQEDILSLAEQQVKPEDNIIVVA